MELDKVADGPFQNSPKKVCVKVGVFLRRRKAIERCHQENSNNLKNGIFKSVCASSIRVKRT